MNKMVLEIIGASVVGIWLLVFGRLFCGKICPIGYLQDLLFKIPSYRKIKSFKADKYLRLIKYVILVFQATMLLLGLIGIATAYPQPAESGLSIVPIIIGVAFVCTAILLQRPFCKYFCFVGALGSLGNKISLYKYRTKYAVCSHCGLCSSVCKMGINPAVKQNSLECIRCGKCKNLCPANAIVTGFIHNENS
jgi:polyferredoxin